jgi:hypothetical protein
MQNVIVAAGVLTATMVLSCPAVARERKAKAGYYTVVLITAADRAVAYEVIDVDKVASRRGELASEYRGTLKAWYAEAADFRKDAANRGKKFDKPRPSMPFLEVAKSNIRGREAADELVATLEARHSIIRIKGGDGKTSFEAVQSSKLNVRKTEIEAEYKAALNAWSEAAAAFRKENPGRSYKEPRPRKPSLVVVRKDLKDRAAAEEEAKKLQAEADKREPARP